MGVVEEGVANFRDFQKDVRDFITRADERALAQARQEKKDKESAEKIDQKRSRIHYWWLALLSALIVAGFSALLTWAINFEARHKVAQQTTSIKQFNAKDE